MSLTVYAFHRTAGGGMEFVEPPYPGAELAGFERWRRQVWGSPAARALGAVFFPQLDGDDLYLEADQLPAFLEECLLLQSKLDELAPAADEQHSAEWYRSTLAVRLRNIEATARSAQELGACLVIW